MILEYRYEAVVKNDIMESLLMINDKIEYFLMLIDNIESSLVTIDDIFVTITLELGGNICGI